MIYKTKPFEHQVTAAKWGLQKDFCALFLEQGTGKTKVTIDLASNWYERGDINAVLVIAPNGVHKQWGVEQIPMHSPVPTEIVVFKSTASKALKADIHRIIYEPTDKLKWFMVNVEAFSYPTYLALFKEYVEKHKCFIVIDEATVIKNPDAKRTMNILRGLSNCKYRGKALTSCSPLSVKRAILTGTPVTNSPFDLWAMFEFLKPGYFERSYYSFKAHYGLQKKMDLWQGPQQRSVTVPLAPEDFKNIREELKEPDGMYKVCAKYGITERDVQYIVDHPESNMPYKYLGELKELISKDAMFITKDECLDLPPKIYKRRVIQMSDEQWRLYNELEEQYITEYDGQEISVLNKLTLYTRLSQIAGGFIPFEDEDGNKSPVLIGKNPKAQTLIEELYLCDYPCIVVTRFAAEAAYLFELITKEFSHLAVGTYTGTKKYPAEPIEAFKQGQLHILIANERMISKGHNLQNAHNVFFYSTSYSLENREQTEDRIHRNGQTEKCLYVDLIMEGTIDMKVYAALKLKKQLLTYIREKGVKDFLTEITDDMQQEFTWL